MVTNKYKTLEYNLNRILDEEVCKIKASVEKYISANKSKGISQMIGRRYGYIWERLVIETFKFSEYVKLEDRVLYKDYVEKWIDTKASEIKNECCIHSVKNIINKFLEENTGTDQQDLCDFTIEENNSDVKYGIDTKFRFVSNDSNTVREIADSARHLKFMVYNPILLFRKDREDSLKSPLNRFEKEGWDLKCGKYAIDFITKKTGFNLGKWIDQNIDIWNELKDYQDKLKDLRFDEENWKF